MGDKDINNRNATGFDSILDIRTSPAANSPLATSANPLFGVNLKRHEPGARSCPANPRPIELRQSGLFLGNFGVDFNYAKLRSIVNANVLWFDTANPLQQFVYQHIKNFIGVDLRPAWNIARS